MKAMYYLKLKLFSTHSWELAKIYVGFIYIEKIGDEIKLM